MKYGYNDLKDGEIIQNYKIHDDKITIEFLDEFSYEIPLTEKNENNLLNLMLEQAKDRSKSSAMSDAKHKRHIALVWIIAQALLTIAFFDWKNWKNISKIISGFLSGFASITVVFWGVEYQFKNDEIKELKKYDIYLSIREKLQENIDNPNLFKNVKNEQRNLNINTLDNYSLSDIKQIQSNLTRIQKYSQHFSDVSNAPKLEKKL